MCPQRQLGSRKTPFSDGIMNTLRTPAEAKAWLIDRGISVKEFAYSHGLDAATTYQILNGRKLGRRGKAHAAAVALGIKRLVSEDE
ncbi:DNA-binding protein [Pseudomonas gingeri]